MDTPAVEPAEAVTSSKIANSGITPDKLAVDAVEGQAPAQAEADSIAALPDWAQKLVKDLRGEAAKNRKAAKDLEVAQTEAQKAAAIEQGKFKELYEKAEAEKQALAAQVQEAQLRDMRSKAAKVAGLPDELATRLQGDTEEAMLEDAKALAAAMRKSNPQKVNNDAAQGTGGKAPSSLDIAGAAKRFNLPSALKALEKAG